MSELETLPLENLISLLDEYRNLRFRSSRQEQKDNLRIVEEMVTGVLKTKYQLDDQGIENALQEYRARGEQ